MSTIYYANFGILKGGQDSRQTLANLKPGSRKLKTAVILDGKFFRVCTKEATKIIASCNFCNRKISGSFSSTSNYLTHLKVGNHMMSPFFIINYDT